MITLLCLKLLKTRLALTVLLFTALTYSTAVAQETHPAPTATNVPPPVQSNVHEAQKDLTALSLEDLMKVSVKSVYGASKYWQKVTEAPASVSIITADDIKTYGYTTLADALRSVRGFYSNYNRAYDDLGTRGFARPGDYNTRVLLLVDGHRIGDDVYSSALVGAQFPISVDLIDRIEVIRGPSSSLYGTNAFFGVINVVTRRGSDLNGGQVTTEAGSYGTYGGRVSYGRTFGNGFDLLLSASVEDSKGHEKLFFKEFDTPKTNNGIAEDADRGDLRQFFANLSWRQFSVQGVYGNRLKALPTASFSTVFNDPRNTTRDERAYLDLKYEENIGNKAQLMARLYYDLYRYSGVYIYEHDDARTVDKDYSYGEWWGAEASLSATIFKKHHVTFGGEYRDNLQQDQRNYVEEPFSDVLDVRRKSREWAVYTQDEYKISNNLFLNAGVRFDWSTAYDASVSPRFGVVYNPFAKTTLKFLYGQAFRAPNVYELTEQVENGPVLRPENIKTMEVVFERYFGDRVRVAASAFSYRINNLIDQVGVSEREWPIFANFGRVAAKGFETEVEASLPYGIRGLASYANQDARDLESNTRLTNSPAHMAKLNFQAPLLDRKLFTGVEMQYLSNRKTLTGRDSGAFMLTNLTLRSEKIHDRFDVSFTVTNLFDVKYANPAIQEHRQDTIPQDGRSFRLKFTYHFAQGK
jgi:outer membrane receptor for ferrienterochelin and colicins